MRNSLLVLFIGLIITITSCRTDFDTIPSSGNLEFSKQTVYLDTVFTNIGSSTYQLKVYNRSNDDIRIPKIQLAKGATSKYRITVDGLIGTNNNSFDNVELLAKDSMFVFIETTASINDANPSDFLYTDEILFDVGSNEQIVNLVTLIQDAYFLYPERGINNDNQQVFEGVILGMNDEGENVISIGATLSESDPINGNELIWNNTKPYVVYGYAYVPNGKTLTVEAGARIHFHSGSGLIVDKDAVLKINGENPTDQNPENIENEVIFEGDRLEPGFAEVAGQWGAIVLLSKSPENSINHLTLKNATVGLVLQNIAPTTNNDEPYLNIKNSQIYNCSNVGIFARKAKIEAVNVVGNNCGEATIACTYGGLYNFDHCTFNNNSSSNSQKAVLLSDNYETTDTIFVNNPNLVFNFTNCIIYGSNQSEFLIDKKGSNTFNHNMKNCLIKYNNSQTNSVDEYDFSNINYYQDCKIAMNFNQFNPSYFDLNNNKLWPTIDLDAIIPPTISITNTDILGKPRTNIGAYQFIMNP